MYTEKAGTLVQNVSTLLRSNIRTLNKVQGFSKHGVLYDYTGHTHMKLPLPGLFKRVKVSKVKGRLRNCSQLKAKET